MSRRVAEEPDPTRAGDLTELEHKAAYFAHILGLPNPPIEPLAYSRDGDSPKHGPIVNGVVLRAAPQPWNWPILKCQPGIIYVCGYRLHDPYATHTAGSGDIRLGSIYELDGKPPVVNTAADMLDEPTKYYIAKTLRRWERFLENELLPRLVADEAAPAATTDGDARAGGGGRGRRWRNTFLAASNSLSVFECWEVVRNRDELWTTDGRSLLIVRATRLRNRKEKAT